MMMTVSGMVIDINAMQFQNASLGLIGCVDRVGCEGGLVEVLLGWVRGYIKR